MRRNSKESLLSVLNQCNTKLEYMEKCIEDEKNKSMTSEQFNEFFTMVFSQCYSNIKLQKNLNCNLALIMTEALVSTSNIAWRINVDHGNIDNRPCLYCQKRENDPNFKDMKLMDKNKEGRPNTDILKERISRFKKS